MARVRVSYRNRQADSGDFERELEIISQRLRIPRSDTTTGGGTADLDYTAPNDQKAAEFARAVDQMALTFEDGLDVDTTTFSDAEVDAEGMCMRLESEWEDLCLENGITDEDRQMTWRRYGFENAQDPQDWAAQQRDIPRCFELAGMWYDSLVVDYLTLRDRKLIDGRTGLPPLGAHDPELPESRVSRFASALGL